MPNQKGALSLSLIVVPYQSAALTILSVSRPPVVPRAFDATESSGQHMEGRVYFRLCSQIKTPFLWSWTFVDPNTSWAAVNGKNSPWISINPMMKSCLISFHISSTPLTLRSQGPFILSMPTPYCTINREVYVLTMFNSKFLDNCSTDLFRHCLIRDVRPVNGAFGHTS